jgi:hypothetical protein
MANELPRIENWIRTTLVGSTAVTNVVGQRVYVGSIPQQAQYPLILIQYLSSTDVQPLNVRRAMTRALYQVLVFARGALDDNARAVGDVIDNLIGFARAATQTFPDGPWVFNGKREQPIALSQPTQDVGGALVMYERLGGDYRIEVYPNF